MASIKIIKVLQVFEKYPVFYQPYIPLLIESLQQKKTLGVKVYSFKKSSDTNVITIPSYNRRRLKKYINTLLFFKKTNFKIEELIWLKEKPQIIHLQHSFLFRKVINILEIDKAKRPKVVITLRGGDTYVKPWVDSSWSNFYIEQAKKVDAFITMSEHQKHYLHNNWGVAIDKIHVIPISFGSTFSILPKSPNPDILKIVSVFRMCWEKNIDGNLRVVKAIVASGIPLIYDVYGDGPDLGQLYYLVNKYDLKAYVNIKGKIDNSLLKDKLIAYDFILQMSHSEAFPTTILEAQSLGIPAIVSQAGGLPESIINDITGYVFDNFTDVQVIANKIVKLWENNTLYNNFSGEAINNAQNNFSIETETKKMLALYQKLTD